MGFSGCTAELKWERLGKEAIEIGNPGNKGGSKPKVFCCFWKIKLNIY